MKVPEYIERRIRSPIPKGCKVVPDSTPVVAFGDPTKARIATLGINPSKREFLDQNENELKCDERRFETLGSLGVTRMAEAPDSAVAKVFKTSCQYFHGNPFGKWFNHLENLLCEIDGSYYKGSACHLDLSQWATNPVWGKLSKENQKLLMDDGEDFLREQIRETQIQLLLLNGRSVLKNFERVFGNRLIEQDPRLEEGIVKCSFYIGYLDKVRVIGWSANLPDHRGLTKEIRRRIVARVAELNKMKSQTDR